MSKTAIKKPWYKKIWIWIIIFIFILGAVGSTAEEEENDMSVSTTATNPTQESIFQTSPPVATSTSIPTTSHIKQPSPIELYVIEYNQDWVGGNSVLITAINKTNKTIAWIQYDLYFLNVKGKILIDDIRGWYKMSIYHGPIDPYGRIEIKNAELFYNYGFHGRYAIDNVIIHYEDGVEEIISIRDLDKYESFIFTSGDNLVICGKHHPYYHIEGCSKLEKNKNFCDLVITINEAKDMGITRCPECLPY